MQEVCDWGQALSTSGLSSASWPWTQTGESSDVTAATLLLVTVCVSS